MERDDILLVANEVYYTILVGCRDGNDEINLADIITVVFSVLDKYFDKFSKINNIPKDIFYDDLKNVVDDYIQQ